MLKGNAMVLMPVLCPYCHHDQVVKRGKTDTGKQHYRCQNPDTVLAYVFGRRMDEVFLQLKALLEPFGIRRFHTDYWGAYARHLEPAVHRPSKRNAQPIER